MMIYNRLLPLAGGVLCLLFGYPLEAIGESVVSVIAPLTGPAAVYGEWAKRGIDMAGVAPTRASLRFEFHDSTGDPKVAVTIATKVLENPGTVAIWTVTSADTMALRDIAARAGVPLITATATSPLITDGRGSVFRTIVNSRQETAVLVEFLRENLNPRSAIIFYINDAGGRASLEEFKSLFSQNQVSILDDISFEKTPEELRTKAIKAAKSKPDIIIVTGYSAAMGAVLRALREVTSVPIACNQGIEAPENLSLPAEVLTDIYYSIAYADDSAAAQRFRAEFKDKYGTEPGIYETTAYDTANMLVAAVSSSSPRTPLAEGLRSHPYNGVNGAYPFTVKGNVRKPVAIKKLVKGSASILATKTPSSE